ncbi:hypothetical protein B0H11DRAFT_2230568 [Mycena galericulata]|nr:hypothetical protein B0H11DRAFT_2230568 [Mycena galericulata]
MPKSNKTKKTNKSSLPPAPPPFRFKGERLAFLQLHVESFMTVFSAGTTGLDAFFDDMYAQYWVRFPWRLEVTQEPFEGMRIDRDTDVLTAKDFSERLYTRTVTHNVTYPLVLPSRPTPASPPKRVKPQSFFHVKSVPVA